MAKSIMIVDDDISNLQIHRSYLEKEYDIITETSGQAALRRLEWVKPDLILLDYVMPGMKGIEILDVIKKSERLKKIPVIILTSEEDALTEKECFVHGASDFIKKPYVAGVLRERIRKTLVFSDLQHNLEEQVYSKTKEAESVILQSIMAIANTIDAKDAYTKGHSERVAEYSAVIAKEMGWEDEEVQLLYNIALLHDIGKIGIPDSILNKPGRLTDEEFAIIKQHTVTGGEILKDIHSMQNAFIAARYHHERYDGKGYPSRLKGEEIPLYARVIAVADAYDAMTSNRVYRKKLSNQIVIDELKKGMGTQFDPKIAGVFIDILTRNAAEAEEADDKKALIPEALSLQQKQLEFEKEHDSVSGLYHRSYAKERLKQIPAREEFVVCMVSIGGFQQLNEDYGRIQGDYVLEQVARIILDSLRGDDFAYRYSGGNLAVCLRNQSSKEESEAFAEMIIKEFQIKKAATAVMKDLRLHIGISMSSTDGRDVEKLHRNADCAAYSIKCQDTEMGWAFYRKYRLEEYSKEKGIDRLVKCLFSQENREAYLVTGNRRLEEMLDTAADFIKTCGESCSMAMFELIAVKENVEDSIQCVNSLNNLELAVMENIMAKDKGIRFSSSQYLVILPENGKESIEAVVKRVTQQYYRMDSSTKFELQSKYVTGVR